MTDTREKPNQWIVRRLNEMRDYHIYLADKVVLTEAVHQLEKIYLPPTLTPETRAEMVDDVVTALFACAHEKPVGCRPSIGEYAEVALDALIAAGKVRV